MGDMKEKEKELFECVNAGKKDDVKRLLADGVSANCKDDTGMAPLQHAAYKCDLELCELLVRHGANVNDNSHDHGYTPLMFAALGGNKQASAISLQLSLILAIFGIQQYKLFYKYIRCKQYIIHGYSAFMLFEMSDYRY